METITANAQSLEDSVKRIIAAFDEDPEREGLRGTPRRFIKFLNEFHAEPLWNFTTFDAEGMDEMIVLNDIPFYSLCEHHLVPFFGKAAIGYIPNGKIVGLSKLPRLLDRFARSFQNQERITQQVANSLMDLLDPVGVAVVLQAEHLCMAMRGVQKPGVVTMTSCMLGSFREHPETRAEFMKFVQG